jgi:hypothetical protein
VRRAPASLGLFEEVAPRRFALTPVGNQLRAGVPGSMRDTARPRDPARSDIFDNAMTPFSTSMIPAALQAYDFSVIKTLVDVAGGDRAVLTAILREYPEMRGVLFDLEHVIAGTRPRIAAMGLTDRCRTEAGDQGSGAHGAGRAADQRHRQELLPLLGHVPVAGSPTTVSPEDPP